MIKDEIELELAWLTRYLPEDLDKCKSTEIKQAYFENSDPEVKDERIREKGGVFTHTIKRFLKSSQETGYTKEETRKLSEKEFLNLWNMAKKKIRKIRYFYSLLNGLTAEVDVYKDNLEGLVVVEVEFPSIESFKKFKKPDWFGKEVTDSKGIYPPVIANMTLQEVDKINRGYVQKPHEFE